MQQFQVSLPPALTIFAQLLMGLLVGSIGVIMAAPLTAALMVMVRTLYIEDGHRDFAAGTPDEDASSDEQASRERGQVPERRRREREGGGSAETKP